MDELGEDEIWEAMTRSKGFDKAALEIDEDDLDLEMEDLPSDFEDSNSEFSDIEDTDFESIANNSTEKEEDDDEEIDFDHENDDETDPESLKDDIDFSAFLEEEEISDSELTMMGNAAKPKDLKKKPKQLQKLSSIASKLGYKGEYFDEAKNVNEFASADDFQALIDQQSESCDEDNREPVKQMKRKPVENNLKKISSKKMKRIV
jgi:hypothetical protein